MNDVPLIAVSGPARERGLIHGRILAERLRAFLTDSLARLGYLTSSPVSLASAQAAIAAHRE